MNRRDELKKEILGKVADYYRLEAAGQPVFKPGETDVPYAARVYDEKEMVHLVEASLDFWLTTGRFAKKFEEGLCSFLGVKKCSLCNSGSSANLLALMALTSPTLGERQLKKGDEVITVAAGFPTTVTPIIQYGAVPVFVDISLPTYNIDVGKMDEARSSRTKAVMLAHTLGNPFNLEAVKAFCAQHGLWLIEDNCDALGSRYQGQWTGTFGDLATSSFYPPHHITTGEGGAVYSNNLELMKRVDSFRDWGRDCACKPGQDNACGQRFAGQFGRLPLGFDHKFVYSHFGYNLKMTDMQAAVGCAQLEKLPGFIEKRKKHFQMLLNGLEKWEGPLNFARPEPGADPAWFGFIMTVNDGERFTRNELAAHLEKSRIQTRPLFAGNLVKHPCFDSLREGFDYRIAGDLAITDRVMNQTLWIGVYPGLTEEKIAYMTDTIGKFIATR